MNNTDISRSNVAVVGGGLVGASAALALADQGFAVTLIDRQRPMLSRGSLGLDIRNVALSPASHSLLDKLGIWSEVPSAPYRHMCIWEQWGNGRVEFDAAEASVTELGWLVEMSPLVCAAWAHLSSHAGVELLLDTIEDVQPADSAVALSLTGGQQREFDFLIAADGAQSIVRKALHLGVLQRPLDQVAVATVVQTEQPHQQTAWQRFLLEGPLALLPSPDEHKCSVVWSQTAMSAKRRLQLEDAAFMREISHASERVLGEVIAVDRRFSFPLTQQRVKNCAPHARVLMVGDAMRVVHPLAGQGVNLGLEDVRCLLEVSAVHPVLSTPGIWQRYARQRQTRSDLMIRAFEALQKIYTNPHPAMSLLRNVGVRSFDALEGLKRQVMREAMGLGQL